MSDDKKLLSENTIRRFMTLANVGPLSDNFIQENSNEEEVNEENEEEVNEENEEEVNEENEEEIQTEGDMAYAREDEEEDPEMDLGAEEAPEEEVELDADLGAEEVPAEAGAADISLTEEEAQLLIDLGSRLGAAMGSAEEVPGDEEEMSMADMEDLGDVGEPPVDAPAEEEEDPVMQEALVQEVLKRVTKRIISEKMKNK